ncbi:coiled-coil domain-containing protein, partial [Facilibium subflavum]|uniref:coiled-coil domain-containing protein n=1 Tax=Facilibium subflavum TaxID=2219058 RepID=UPI0013C3390E
MSAGKHLSCLFLSLYVSTVVADIGVWGNIIMINDLGREDQPSLTGFRVSNNSPYAVEFLGANGGGVQFNTIEDNFNTPEGAEYTFTNRFLALEDDTPEAQAFFRICPHGYSRCLYFKLVSLRRDYGFYGYTGNKAADEHQKDFKGYVQSLTTVSPVEAALTSHGVSFVTIMGGLYNLQRIASYQKMVNSLQAELGTATKNLLNASNKANLTSQDIQQLNSDISVAQNNIKEMKSEINEMKNFRKKYGSAENKTALFKDGKENFQHYHNNMKSTEKMVTNLKKEEFKLTTKHESRANKLNTAKQNYDHLRNKIQSAQANIKKTGVGRAVNSKFWTTFTMVVIPVIATYVGLLRSTRGSHQGLWETAFMAYSLEKITQDDVNMYSFIPEEALQTDFDFIDGNTASETIRLSFDGDDIDNQPIVEMSLSVLSNVWNRALIRKDKEGDWGEDKFRGVLKEEARWGVPEVEWKQSGALLLSIKSFNDLEFINLYQSEKEARELMDIGTSSMMIFDAPELYRGDADLSKINLEQDLRVLEASSNDDQDTKTLPLEALSIKNGEYG